MSWDRRDTLAALLLALAPFLLFWPLFAPGEARQWLVAGDFVDQFYAFARYETARLAAGELPLWNPYAYGGSPFWADVQAAVAYPPSLAVVLFSAWRWGELPLLALELEAVAHLSLAAVLTYAFARHALGSRVGGLVAAAGFGASGYLLGYPMLQLAVLETDAWLPLALLGGSLVAARPGRLGPLAALRAQPALALALALGILAGHPQSALYLLYLTGAWVLWRAWRERPAGIVAREAMPRSPGSSDIPVSVEDARTRATRGLDALAHRLGWALPALLGLAGSLALAAGLSAAGWWPALEFLGLSNRAEAHYAMLANGFPPQELLGMVLPGLTLWSPLYLGVPALALALAATLAWARGAEAEGGESARSPLADLPFWAGLALLSLLLSLGRHGFLFDLFYLLAPGFDLFRGQERAAFAFSFALAMMAGAGAAYWWRGGRAAGRDLARVTAGLSLAGGALALVAGPAARDSALHLALASGATALLVLLAPWAGIGRRAPEVAGPRDGPGPAASPSPGIGTGHARGSRPRALAWLGLLLLVLVLDPWIALGRVNLAASPPEELVPSPVLALLSQDRLQRVDNEDRLPRNFGVLHGMEATSGASPLRLRRFEALREGLADQPVRWRDLMAVSHVLSWREELEVQSVVPIRAGEGESATYLHQLDWVAPYAWRALRAETVAGEAEAIERLRAEDFPALSAVLLEAGPDGAGPSAIGAEAGEAAGDPRAAAGASVIGAHEDAEADTAPASAASASLSLRARRPGYARVQTEGPAPAWVVFSELHYPGWRATVDGLPAELLRADLALMAVPIPAGEHVVELRFEAPRVRQGLIVSLLSTLLLVTFVLRQPSTR